MNIDKSEWVQIVLLIHGFSLDWPYDLAEDLAEMLVYLDSKKAK